MRSKICFILSIILLLTATTVAQEAGTATPVVEEEPPSITIWWPDVLALGEGNNLHPILMEQTEAFLANEENLNLEYRLKPVGIAGGIMSTLRTATNVAPGALPSLTLIRRQDLLAAERAGYLQSLEGQVSSAIQGDLETALALGQVDNVLYGVPYLLELQHLVYRPESNTDYSDWTYQAILDRKLPFLFAGGRVGGLSDVFYLQYLSDGGTLDSEGLLTLDESALLKTLSFYQAASDMGLVDGFNMNYSSSRDYMNAFIAGEYNIGIFDSGTFLRLHQDETGLQIASIPTSNGEATSILNGWIWVMIARDEDEQAAASRYLNWMMDTERQAEFARAIYQVPSRQSALALGLVSDAPIEPYLAMLENPVLPVSDGEVGSLGRLIQEALSSVVTLELSADEALDYVVQELTE